MGNVSILSVITLETQAISSILWWYNSLRKYNSAVIARHAHIKMNAGYNSTGSRIWLYVVDPQQFI